MYALDFKQQNFQSTRVTATFVWIILSQALKRKHRQSLQQLVIILVF